VFFAQTITPQKNTLSLAEKSDPRFQEAENLLNEGRTGRSQQKIQEPTRARSKM